MVPEVAGSIPVSHPSFFLFHTIRMADILPIYGYGFSVLKRRAVAIEMPDADKAVFAEAMFATMDASDGVGLAAPQVGVSERLFVIDSQSMIDEESDEQGIRKAFFNPEILEESGQPVGYEVAARMEASEMQRVDCGGALGSLQNIPMRFQR